MRYHVADFVIDSASRCVHGPQGTLVVPRRVFDCLIYLIEHRDRAVARDELIVNVWNRGNVSDTQLAQAVLRVRRLFCDDGNVRRFVRTVPGFGYHWSGEVTVDTAFAGEGSAAACATAACAAVAPSPGTRPAVRGTAGRTAPAGHLRLLRRRRGSRWTLIHRAASARPRLMVALLSLTAALSTLVLGATYRPAPATPGEMRPRHIVVLPVAMDVVTAREAAWGRLGLMELVATRLRAEGVRVSSSLQVLAALDARAAGDTGGARPPVLPQADVVLQPTLVRLPSGWQFSIEAHRTNRADLVLHQRHPQLLDAVSAAGDALLRRLDEDSPWPYRQNAVAATRASASGRPDTARGAPAGPLRVLLDPVEVRCFAAESSSGAVAPPIRGALAACATPVARPRDAIPTARDTAAGIVVKRDPTLVAR